MGNNATTQKTKTTLVPGSLSQRVLFQGRTLHMSSPVLSVDAVGEEYESSSRARSIDARPPPPCLTPPPSSLIQDGEHKHPGRFISENVHFQALSQPKSTH